MYSNLDEDKLEQLGSTLIALEELSSQFGADGEGEFQSAEDPGNLYLLERALQEQPGISMEEFNFQTIKDAVSAAGRLSVATGKAFMGFLDQVHKTVDGTYLVNARLLGDRISKIRDDRKTANFGKMERRDLAKAMSVNGVVEYDHAAIADALVATSNGICRQTLPQQAAVVRALGEKLSARRSEGLGAYTAAVDEMVRIIASARQPIDMFDSKHLEEIWPGNRRIFQKVRPGAPRRAPVSQDGGVRKLVLAVSSTSVGIRGKIEVTGAPVNDTIPILTPEQMVRCLASAKKLLEEAVNVSKIAKSFAKDKTPSAAGLMLSGILNGLRQQIADITTAQDDGYDVIEGPSGGGVQTVRHKPGTRGFNPLGSPNLGLEARKEMSDEEIRDRILQGVWVARYTKISLIDHQRTARAMVMLLMGVGRTYLKYVEESLKYYEQR